MKTLNFAILVDPRNAPMGLRAWIGHDCSGRIDVTADRIEINPEVMLGKPVIRGTRITVESLMCKA
jgi:hypothetical protein